LQSNYLHSDGNQIAIILKSEADSNKIKHNQDNQIIYIQLKSDCHQITYSEQETKL